MTLLQNYLRNRERTDLLKILGYKYRVVEAGHSDIIGAFGRNHVSRQLVQIASNLVDQQRESTILHEIIEAISYHLELGLSHAVIMSLEASLYQVLTDNGIDLSPLSKLIELPGDE